MESVPKRQQKTTVVERLNGGKLRIERRNGSPNLYASAYLDGKNVAKSTGEESLNAARKFALDWYLEKLDRIRRGEHLHGRLFADCVDGFLKHADVVAEVSEGQRRNYRQKWNLLKGYFEGVKVTDVDASFLMNLRKDRSEGPLKKKAEGAVKKKPWKRPSNATLKKDTGFVQLVLKHAKEWMKCLDTIPPSPSFRGRTWKVIANPRPFLSYDEWKVVRARARDRAQEQGLNPRTRRQRQELYCFLMICVGGAFRVEEAYSLLRLSTKSGPRVMAKSGPPAVDGRSSLTA